MFIASDEQYYQIKLEDERTGYIPKKSEYVVFQTWEEYVLDRLVGFDPKTNPLRKEPSEDSDTLYYEKDEFYISRQIKGEWIQVEWGSYGKWNYGWVKWKNDGRLIIELYYFA